MTQATTKEQVRAYMENRINIDPEQYLYDFDDVVEIVDHCKSLGVRS